MAYKWLSTGSLDMTKIYNFRDSEAMAVVGGVQLDSQGRPYRRYGVSIAPLGDTVLRRTGTLYGGTALEFWQLENELRGMHGTAQAVRRKRRYDGVVQSASADIGVSLGEQINVVAREVTITATLLTAWRGVRRGETPVYGQAAWGDGWIYGGDVRSGDIGSAVTLANGGNYFVSDAIITINVTSGSFTSFTISDGESNDLSLDLSADDGDEVVIDCGSRTIKKNSVIQDAILVRESSHRHSDWLRIPSSGSSVTLSGIGGGSGTHSYKYREKLR